MEHSASPVLTEIPSVPTVLTEITIPTVLTEITIHSVPMVASFDIGI